MRLLTDNGCWVGDPGTGTVIEAQIRDDGPSPLVGGWSTIFGGLARLHPGNLGHPSLPNVVESKARRSLCRATWGHLA